MGTRYYDNNMVYYLNSTEYRAFDNNVNRRRTVKVTRARQKRLLSVKCVSAIITYNNNNYYIFYNILLMKNPVLL